MQKMKQIVAPEGKHAVVIADIVDKIAIAVDLYKSWTLIFFHFLRYNRFFINKSRK